MEERSGITGFHGSPVTLLGPGLQPGDRAPDFRVVDNDLATVTLADFRGKIKIICTVPSLDTPVCATEARRFNREAAQLDSDIVVLIVSVDLPFAQSRWCAAKAIDRLHILSDYQERSLGLAYGVLIKERQLLARSVFVVDQADTIRYIQLVAELTEEPDYATALEAAKGLLIPVSPLPMDGICGGY
jgi:thiol peroxidase